MKSNASLIYSLILVVGDFLALVAAFVFAYAIRGTLSTVPVAHPIPATTYVSIFLTLLPFWILIFALLGLYNSSIQEKRFNELGRLLIGSFVGLLFVISYGYAVNKTIFPARLVPVYGFVLAFLFLVIFRNLARAVRAYLYKYDIGITNILIIGNTKIATELVRALSDSKISGYRIVGIVGNKSHTPERFPHIPVFDSFGEAAKKLRTNDIHSIVQTELYAAQDTNNEMLEFAQTHHIAYRFVPGNSELFVGNIAVELFRSQIPVIAVHQTALIGWGRIIKRVFDLLVSVIALVILSPLLILISLLILVFDPGPIIFQQKRITRFDNRFKAYKFRTMKRKYSNRGPIVVFKELGREDLIKAYQGAQKLTDDPRISLIGRFLRRFSLDELPQLINVVKGDISLVGPRAVVPAELKYYASKSPMLLSIKTGITGLAQVSGRSNLDYYERAKLDLYYIQNWSFWLDLTILVKTIRVIFRRGGVR
ncbi:sugar transferase [Candidatus Saccharibacteria bacterium]|nr:sugar transferase [Candidatus Saccharibacteria bacterium]